MGGSAHCWKCNCKHARPCGRKCHRIEAVSHPIPVIPVLPGQNVPMFPDAVAPNAPGHGGLNLPAVSAASAHAGINWASACTQATAAFTRQSQSATQARASTGQQAYANYTFPGHATQATDHLGETVYPAGPARHQGYVQSADNSRLTHESRGRTRQLSSPPRSPILDIATITNAIASAVSESLAPVNARLAALETREDER